MTRHLPAVLADKLDAYLARKNERIRRDSLFNFFVAVVSIGLALYTLSIGAGYGSILVPPGVPVRLVGLMGLPRLQAKSVGTLDGGQVTGRSHSRTCAAYHGPDHSSTRA
ncbi:MAG: hypothetical protein WAU45_04085 [Blastocatellia bacterium]